MKQLTPHLARATWIGLLLALIGAGLSYLWYDQLPDPMPTHFDLNGLADDYRARALGAFLLPAIIAALAGFFYLLPRISPRGYSMEESEDSLAIVTLAVEGFMLVLHVAVLDAARHHAPLSMALVGVGLGALFAVMGNRMGKVRRNFFLGIRTPWTLADKEVWLRTHRLGGRLMVLTGVAGAVLSVAGVHVVFWAPALVISLLGAALYSLIIYRRLHGTGPGARA